jgi:arylformamidase
MYDISRSLTPTTAVWPGDTAFHFDRVLELAKGHSVNLTTLHLSAHTGTHADAPYHYTPDGEHPAATPLDHYIGPAHVASIQRENGGITPADFSGHDLSGLKRLLIHTWVSELPDDQWAEDFPYPTLELIDWLADQGGVLLGVDMPSVDSFDSKDLPGHHRLYQRGLRNLESLSLAGVPDGRYELIALPLKLDGVCGSPVRAILKDL